MTDKDFIREKLDSLTDEQAKEIKSVIDGSLTEKSLLDKGLNAFEKFITNLKDAFDIPLRTVVYRLSIIGVFALLIFFLSAKFFYPNDTPVLSGDQTSTLLGTLIGFIFGKQTNILS